METISKKIIDPQGSIKGSIISPLDKQAKTIFFNSLLINNKDDISMEGRVKKEERKQRKITGPDLMEIMKMD